MSDEVTGAASAPAPAAGSGSFLGGFPPAHLSPPEQPVTSEAPVETQSPEGTKKPEALQSGLAELIRQQREARQAREHESTRAKGLEAQLTEAKSELERIKRDSDFEADPVAYAKARGWDKEKQALMGQILLYDLVPDKAPPGLAHKLFESKQARKEREQAEAAERAGQEAAQRAQAEQYASFVGVLDESARQFDPGSHPESDAWFVDPETGDHDHDTYVASLVATAVNMATVAQREGRVADLRPASVAKVLEDEVARRFKARDARVQKRAVKQQPAGGAPAAKPAGGGVQPTESTKGTYGGMPQPKATSERERIQRAMAVAFKPR